MVKKVILKKDKIAFFIIFAFTLLSCSSKKNNRQKFIDKNFPCYAVIFQTIMDSVTIYSGSILHDFQSEYIWEWQIDSLVCINSSKDKLIAVILNSSGIGKGMNGDSAGKLLGKKINGKWYFFKGGGTLIIPRDMYKKNEMNPLTFHELSRIARDEFLSGAIIKKDGKLVVNDEWVDAHFYNNGLYTFGKHKTPGMVLPGEEFQMPRDKAKFDSVHWALIIGKWKKRIDTTTFKKYVPKPNS
jgi:hypothetical protein